MPITETELIDGIEAKNNFPLDENQKQAICYGNGPLLIAAGPGTGKTEVLVARCLKFMCCDNVSPSSIILTTFTEKAARNLQDRLSGTFLFLVNRYPHLNTIDPSALRIGTLHSLCHDIMQEYRYTAYYNLRLLNEIESSLLIHKSVVGNISEPFRQLLYEKFIYLFTTNNTPKPFRYLNKWDWALALQQIFNRLIEDQINLEALHQQTGTAWQAIWETRNIYEQALSDAHACDFSQLLKYFREFLDTDQGSIFLSGDTTGIKSPLSHILVDEYQDTNPIQESIYFRLCDAPPHNLTVVGDDDQALYRFRGGTVECMVGFPSTCQTWWNIDPSIIYLSDNHRSDSKIVEWCNNYITSFPQMAEPNVRILGKPVLTSTLGRTGEHPGVSLIRGASLTICADGLARLVLDLKTHNIIQDYSQCVLLLRSTKNSSQHAGPYTTALQTYGIPIYNPRSKDYLEQEDVAQCLGAFIRIIDPKLANLGNLRSDSIRQLVQAWVDEYDRISLSHPNLASYINKSAAAIAEMDVLQLITPATPTILYRILAHQPFTEYQNNPERDLRISKLTRLFESFCSQYGSQLRTDGTIRGQLSSWWYGAFYYGFCGYLVEKGLDNDEDEEVVCPRGYFPIMTIHQAKGLEFDFVFAGDLGKNIPASSSTHQLEQTLRTYRNNPPEVFHTPTAAQWHDEIRQHFVAYSRAKFALILIASDSQLRKNGNETASFGSNGGSWLRQNTTRL